MGPTMGQWRALVFFILHNVLEMPNITSSLKIHCFQWDWVNFLICNSRSTIYFQDNVSTPLPPMNYKLCFILSASESAEEFFMNCKQTVNLAVEWFPTKVPCTALAYTRTMNKYCPAPQYKMQSCTGRRKNYYLKP